MASSGSTHAVAWHTETWLLVIQRAVNSDLAINDLIGEPYRHVYDQDREIVGLIVGEQLSAKLRYSDESGRCGRKVVSIYVYVRHFQLSKNPHTLCHLVRSNSRLGLDRGGRMGVGGMLP